MHDKMVILMYYYNISYNRVLELPMRELEKRKRAPH